MNEVSTPEKTPIFARPWALRFGFALLAGLTLVVGLAFSDQSRRGALETVAETTAVGDAHFYNLPAGAKLPVLAATLRGRPLSVVSAELLEVRDTHVARVERDAASGLTIYELASAATPEERQGLAKAGAAFLLKSAVNEFLPARTAGP